MIYKDLLYYMLTIEIKNKIGKISLKCHKHINILKV